MRTNPDPDSGLDGLLRARRPADYARLGDQALDYTRQVVELGPRPAGSDANRKQQALIVEHLRGTGCAVTEDKFTGNTPLGPREMENILCDFAGTSGRIIAVTGHYDTLGRPNLKFVGANDGGSSTGALLALADLLAKQQRKDTVPSRVFRRRGVRSRLGERRPHLRQRTLAEAWAKDGTDKKLLALINIDMIGDAGLSVLYEGNSTPWLRDLVFGVAQRLGYKEEFPVGSQQYIEDDHIPFVQRGMPALDLIDFDYGLYNRYWHTENDTLENLSPRSFAVILHVLDESIRELEKRP